MWAAFTSRKEQENKFSPRDSRKKGRPVNTSILAQEDLCWTSNLHSKKKINIKYVVICYSKNRKQRQTVGGGQKRGQKEEEAVTQKWAG